MLVPCPHCGERDEAEFDYGGDADVTVPHAIEDPQAWSEHAYLRRNPKGAHVELWFHIAGCQRWLRVSRDTTDHRIAGATEASRGGEALRGSEASRGGEASPNGEASSGSEVSHD